MSAVLPDPRTAVLDFCPQDQPYLIQGHDDGTWTFHRAGFPVASLGLALVRSGDPLPWDPSTLLVLPGMPARLDGGTHGLPVAEQHPACSPVPIPLDAPWRGPWPPGVWRCRTCGESRGVAPRKGDQGPELVSLACWCRNVAVAASRGLAVPEWKHLVGAWRVMGEGHLYKETYRYRQFAGRHNPEAYAASRSAQNLRLAEVRSRGLEPPLGPWGGVPYPEGPFQDLGTWLAEVDPDSEGQPLSPVTREAGA